MKQRINLKNVRPRKNAPGQGRPSTIEAGEGYRVFTSGEDREYLKITGDGNVSRGVRILVERDKQRNLEHFGSSSPQSNGD